MKRQDNTREKILAVAGELFVTKGFENTRVSDIIEGLDGLTKGAVYHYFSSKEDIFEAFAEEMGQRNSELYDSILYDTSLKGNEKLTKFVNFGLNNDTVEVMMKLTPNLLTNPKLLAVFMTLLNEETIDHYLLPIIEEGIEDGSIDVKYPKELAQLIALLLNVWLNPLILPNDKQSVKNKIMMINQILKGFNIELFADLQK
jgi:AcrR family transcriptional regulator